MIQTERHSQHGESFQTLTSLGPPLLRLWKDRKQDLFSQIVAFRPNGELRPAMSLSPGFLTRAPRPSPTQPACNGGDRKGNGRDVRQCVLWRGNLHVERPLCWRKKRKSKDSPGVVCPQDYAAKTTFVMLTTLKTERLPSGTQRGPARVQCSACAFRLLTEGLRYRN